MLHKEAEDFGQGQVHESLAVNLLLLSLQILMF